MGIVEGVIEDAIPGGALVKAAGSLKWLLVHPAVLAAVVCAGVAVFEHHEAARWRAVADQRGAALAAIPVAQAKALAAQVALNASVAAKYQSQAEISDANYKTALADAGADADRYIAAHRLRPAAHPGGTSSPSGTAQAGDSNLPADMPADGVVVSASDVQKCTGATSYAVTAHNSAVDAIAASTAIPAPEIGDK